MKTFQWIYIQKVDMHKDINCKKLNIYIVSLLSLSKKY